MAALRPDVDLGHTTIIASWVFTALTLILIGAVTYVRFAKLRKFGIEGGLIVLATLILVAQVSHITWAIHFEKANKHVDEMSHSDSILLSKSLAVNEAIWGIASTFVRISALVGVHSLSGGVSKLIRYSFWILLPLLVAFGLVNILQVPLMCRPLQAMWDSTIDGHCANETVVYLTFEAIGLVLDLVLLFPPAALVWRLNMKLNAKILFFALFGVPPLLCFTVTGLRLEAFKLVSSSDFTYTKGYIGLLSTLGVALGLIASSITYSKLLWGHFAASWASFRSKRNFQHRSIAATVGSSISLSTRNSFISLSTRAKSSPQLNEQHAHWVGQQHECFKHMSSDQEKLAHKIDLENQYCTHHNRRIKERSWEEHGQNCFYKACKNNPTQNPTG